MSEELPRKKRVRGGHKASATLMISISMFNQLGMSVMEKLQEIKVCDSEILLFTPVLNSSPFPVRTNATTWSRGQRSLVTVNQTGPLQTTALTLQTWQTPSIRLKGPCKSLEKLPFVARGQLYHWMQLDLARHFTGHVQSKFIHLM